MMKPYRYKNPWHTPSGNYGPEFYEANSKPHHYRGYDIYRQGEKHYDIVKDGMCITQRCGWSKELIDRIINGEERVTLIQPPKGDPQ
jgi:hypothetical protein